MATSPNTTTPKLADCLDQVHGLEDTVRDVAGLAETLKLIAHKMAPDRQEAEALGWLAKRLSASVKQLESEQEDLVKALHPLVPRCEAA